MNTPATQYRYFWIFTFDQAGRAALDSATLARGRAPVAQGTQAAAVITIHFVPVTLGAETLSLQVATETDTAPDPNKNDVQVVPIEGNRDAAQRWLAGDGAAYRDNAIAYRLCRIAVGAQ